MSEAESPARRRLGATVSVDDVRELTAAATPHFAQQLRNRVARLVAELPADDPVRRFAEAEITRLTALGRSGEVRGAAAQDGMPGLPSTALPGRPS
ncbi:MAG: hypothetical protein M0P31_14755 [Solirubrobacteraceae bacterium]|nr:hypothetical protein [Solirubrobacteraceae bacterium]